MVPLIAWAVLAAAYLFFAGQLSADELVAAALSGAVAAVWGWATRRVSPQGFRLDRAALAAVLRAVAGLPSATLKVGVRLIAHPAPGRIVSHEFARGVRDRPEEAGRRAIVTLAASLAPDSFVLRIPEGQDCIEVHSLTGDPLRDDPRWPA